MNPEGFWAIVELMGHVRIAGFVTEEDRFGVRMGRIDIYDGEKCVTQFFSGSSVYRITPVEESIARDIGKHTPAPVSRWELSAKVLPAGDDRDDEEDFPL